MDAAYCLNADMDYGRMFDSYMHKMVRTRRDPGTYECPICMDPVRFAVETNCGHMYCGNCILRVWHTSTGRSPLLCPYCRQDVTLLLSCFTEREANVADLLEAEERESVAQQIGEYNRRFSSHPRSIWGQIRDLPTILRHVWAELFTWRGLEMFYRLRVILCFVVALLYVVTPFDVIPEALLGLLGLLDDCIVVLFMLIQVGVFYRSYVGGGE